VRANTADDGDSAPDFTEQLLIGGGALSWRLPSNERSRMNTPSNERLRMNTPSNERPRINTPCNERKPLPPFSPDRPNSVGGWLRSRLGRSDAVNPKLQTLNPNPQTVHPTPYTLNY
jgi:hypothetical protein